MQLSDDFGGRRLFPDDNWWNLDVSNAPVDPQSSAYIDYIGRTRTSHPDFGPPPYGIPYVGVGNGQPRVPITFTAYGSESDSGFGGEAGYPIPPEAAPRAGRPRTGWRFFRASFATTKPCAGRSATHFV